MDAERKTMLVPGESPPLCPWCDALLSRVHWHKVQGSPGLLYIIILSCSRCRAVLDVVSASSSNHAPAG